MQAFKKILARMCLGVIGVTLGLVVLEVLVRIVFPQNFETLPQGLIQLDQTLGYRLASNYKGVQRQIEFSITIETNSEGLRDREYGEKSRDKVRILVLGDSMTFGNGVNVQDTWPKVLEKMLQDNQPAKKWEVINAGVGGYGADHFETYFKKYCSWWDPDYVIVGFLASHDVYRNIRHDYYIKSGRLYVTTRQQRFVDKVIYPANDYLRQRSQLYVLLKAKLRDTAASLVGGKLSKEFIFPGTLVKSAQSALSTAWQKALNHLRNLSSFAKDNSGAKTYLVIIPSMFQAHPGHLKQQLSVYNIPAEDVDVWLPNKILLRLENEMPVFDLLPEFLKRANITPLYYPIDGHWNKNGHRLAGELIYEWLTVNKLLPVSLQTNNLENKKVNVVTRR